MKPQLKATGNFKIGRNSAELENIPIFIIKEDNVIIYYSPVFDLSGYGANESEAEKSLQISIEEFFKYTLNKKTLDTELSKLGWVKPKRKRKKRYNPPVMSDMIQMHDYLSEIINHHDFRKETMPIVVPA